MAHRERGVSRGGRAVKARISLPRGELTLQTSTNCQRIGQPQPDECYVEAEDGLPATEPT